MVALFTCYRFNDQYERERTCSPIEEYDLERKIELEVKMKEGSSRLLAAARHPAQSLEAARALLTSSKRMTAYMAELQHRRKDTSPKTTSTSESRGKLSISDLRFPLMWRDSDHFKNRGDHRRFAVFCLARVGTEIHDTSLLCPVDREQTDISFPDVLLFNNVPAEFEVILEIYSHVLQEDLSIASTPRRISRTIHSSISKTVGRKFAASLRDEYDSSKTGPQFNLVAYAKMTLDDSDTNTRTHDLVLNNFENKVHALPLFGHFCCRLAVQPDCIDKEVRIGFVNINDQRCWARLRGFEIETWKSKKLAEGSHEPTYTIDVNKETLVRQSKSMYNQLRIINSVDGTKKRDTIEFNTKEDLQKWFEQLTTRINEHSRWKHAAVNLQRIPCSDNSSGNTSARNSFVGNRQGSLYDETPLIESIFPNSVSRITKPKEACKLASEYHGSVGRASTTVRPRPSIIEYKSHWQFTDTIHHR
ncbi:rhotekin-2-like isoform X2 [Hylaeus anthracinus]|uniref:rhotekin-2-like isoform X2 n=1 Tax=Hylaeus anthracinus TaxID=313031 RepID=UPI0023B96565|nr:rhotekin-2-like isoform X2 [Hylaeus anthracinus]XP_054010075.1 rhotekin-2-like isoform X2 [Hylaeus anthracinus]